MLSILELRKWGREVVIAHKVDDYYFDDDSQKLSFIVYIITKYNICDNYYQKDVIYYLTHPSALYYARKLMETSSSELLLGLWDRRSC